MKVQLYHRITSSLLIISSSIPTEARSATTGSIRRRQTTGTSSLESTQTTATTTSTLAKTDDLFVRDLSEEGCAYEEPGTFEDIIEVDIADLNITSNLSDLVRDIGDYIKEEYNLVADHSCDPYMRRLNSVTPITLDPPARTRQLRGEESSSGDSRRLKGHLTRIYDPNHPDAWHREPLLWFYTEGDCKPCPNESYGYDAGIGRNRRLKLSSKKDEEQFQEKKSDIHPRRRFMEVLDEFDDSDTVNYETCTCPTKVFNDGPPPTETLIELLNGKIAQRSVLSGDVDENVKVTGIHEHNDDSNSTATTDGDE